MVQTVKFSITAQKKSRIAYKSVVASSHFNSIFFKNLAFFGSVTKRDCLIDNDNSIFSFKYPTLPFPTHALPYFPQSMFATTLLPPVTFSLVLPFYLILGIARIQFDSTRKSTSASTGTIYTSSDSATQAGV
jgi:hypothetical protein